MSEANTATPLPAPDAGATPQPNLSVLPEPGPERRAPLALHRGQEAELAQALDLATTAQRPEYAPALARHGIDPAFVTTLLQDIQTARQKGQQAVDSTSARKDATQTEAAAAETLKGTLRAIQSSARQKHLPEHPELLGSYYVGQPLDQSRPLLQAQSQNILNKAGAERPPGVDTNFLQKAETERASYLAAGASQSAEVGEGKQARAERDALVKSIKARRKKIQYAANALWPPKKPECAQARSDFKLPANRPYSY